MTEGDQCQFKDFVLTYKRRQTEGLKRAILDQFRDSDPTQIQMACRSNSDPN